jgi:adenine-specific DNA-methyltransferase
MTSETSKNLGKTPNPAEDNRRKLAELLPEAFSEGRLDIAALRRTLGEDAVIEGGERYRLDWAGKSDAYKVLQTPSTGTLRPQRDKSINFDTAQHVFIEGENLEVLKILQKSYFGKVKLIYIDPPYNTGNDSFIYPDRFQESKEDYLKRINDLTDDGTLMREGFFRKNSRENGHYHSNWLNMMLPRLYIARNLLRDDGVIFISCDDNEVHNLRCLMNEIFGDENFIAQVVWKNATDNNPTNIAVEHEYMLAFARNKPSIESEWKSSTSEIKDLLVRVGSDLTSKFKDEELEAAYQEWFRENRDQLGPLDRYKYIDAGGIYTGSQSVHNPGREGYRYDVIHPRTGRPCKQPLLGYRFPIETMQQLLAQGRVLFGESDDKIVELKVYAHEYQEKFSSIFDLDGRLGAYDLREDFPELTKAFTNPKPVRFLTGFFPFVLKADGDIVLDFFCGSGTTAVAVLDLNRKDLGHRKFILVQLPEPCDEKSDAAKAGFADISHICRERIRRVFDRMGGQGDQTLFANLGLKSLVLAPSNLRQWRGDGIDTAEELGQQIEAFVRSEKEGGKVEDVLYELILRFGQELTVPVESLTVEGNRVFAIRERKMLFVLESFTEPMIDALLKLRPDEIIALDSVFRDSDPLKTNLDLQCRDAGVKFTCI